MATLLWMGIWVFIVLLLQIILLQQLLMSSCCGHSIFSVLLCDTCCSVLSRFSHVRLFMTPWPVARQPPLSMGFSRQEYWSGLPCPPPGDLPDPGIKPVYLTSPTLQEDSTAEPWRKLILPLKAIIHMYLTRASLVAQ